MVKLNATIEIADLYDVDEAANLLEKGVATIWRWIRDDKIIAVRIGDRTLIPESEIERIREGKMMVVHTFLPKSEIERLKIEKAAEA